MAAADDVSATLAPLHTDVTVGVITGTAGNAFTVTRAVAFIEQVPFVATNT